MKQFSHDGLTMSHPIAVNVARSVTAFPVEAMIGIPPPFPHMAVPPLTIRGSLAIAPVPSQLFTGVSWVDVESVQQ